MTLETFADIVRRSMGETSSTYLTNAKIEDAFYQAVNENVVPTLWALGKYVYFPNEALTTSEFTGATEKESAYLGCNHLWVIPNSDLTNVFIPSLSVDIEWSADVGTHRRRVHFVDTHQIYKFIGNPYAYYEPDYLGEVRGNEEIRVYVTSDLALSDATINGFYVEFLTDIATNDISWPERFLQQVVIPAVCMRISAMDTGRTAQDYEQHKALYKQGIQSLAASQRTVSNPPVPPIMQNQREAE